MAGVRTDPEERSKAVAIYREHGLAEAHRRTGRAKATLQDWARQEGFDVHDIAGEATEKTRAASEARAERILAGREELREQLLTVAMDMLERTRQPHIDYRGKDADKIEFDQAPAQACQQYITAAAIAIDKLRLESGESTSKSETTIAEPKRVQNLRDDLAHRRAS